MIKSAYNLPAGLVRACLTLTLLASLPGLGLARTAPAFPTRRKPTMPLAMPWSPVTSTATATRIWPSAPWERGSAARRGQARSLFSSAQTAA